jgi:hypothetical protein
MSAEDLLRLAWQANRNGQPTLRDALMTLAVVESGPDEAVYASRCRRWLIAKRPDHWLTSFATLGQAVNHPRVVQAIERLRSSFPPARVRQLLFRDNVLRGPYQERSIPISLMVDDLLGTSVAGHSAERVPTAPISRGRETGSHEVPALPFSAPGGDFSANAEAEDDAASLLVTYLTVLMAMAILLASVLPPSVKDSRAA